MCVEFSSVVKENFYFYLGTTKSPCSDPDVHLSSVKFRDNSTRYEDRLDRFLNISCYNSELLMVDVSEDNIIFVRLAIELF